MLQRRPNWTLSLTHGATASATAAIAGGLFIGICAQVRIPLGFTPVPVTLQVFGVLVAALMLGPRTGACAALLYLAMASAGLPLWSGGQGGTGYLLTGSGSLVAPTLGYLLAFPAAAYLTGWLKDTNSHRSPAFAAVCGLAGAAAIHAGGLAWIWIQYVPVLGAAGGLYAALVQGVFPFVLLDAAKALAAAAAADVALRALGRTRPAG